LNIGTIPDPGILKFIKVFFLTLLAVFSTALFSDFFQAEESSLLFPEATALADFEFTDLLFNQRAKPLPDTNIVLVNIGNLSRRGIARQIEKIASQKPKVLGIDCFFRMLKDPEADSLLSLSMSKIKNLVLVGELANKENSNYFEFDTVFNSHPKFAQYGSSGFDNLITSEDDAFRTCRTFIPTENINGKIVNSFGIEIVDQLAPQKVKEFVKRQAGRQPINFRRNQEEYTTIDAAQHDSIGFNSSVNLKDKIVMMGYLGGDCGLSIHDKFHTPLNVAPLGKSYPDMAGLVIHANIVSMVLNQDFIHYPAEWATFFINFLIVFCHILLLMYGHKKLNAYFDLLALSLLLLQIIFFAYLRYYLFMEYSIQLDLNITVGTLALASVIVSISYLPVFNRLSLVSVRNRFQKKASHTKAL